MKVLERRQQNRFFFGIELQYESLKPFVTDPTDCMAEKERRGRILISTILPTNPVEKIDKDTEDFASRRNRSETC